MDHLRLPEPRRSAPARRLIVLLVVATSALAVAGARPLGRVQAADVVNILGIAANHSSVRIQFGEVVGARDYRAYDVANPNDVKYAGLTQESSRSATPATQIDWNLVGDGEVHTVVVEALDRLGPVPYGSLYDPATNAPLFYNRPTGSMIGGNKGQTLDGKISTNGQGPYANGPRVLARSRPFLARADRSYRSIPSHVQAASTFFDTFDNSESVAMAMDQMDANVGTMTYTLNAGTSRAWTIEYQQADVLHSMPFIAADHFMDVLFDGGTPGTNVPLHQGHAVMAMSPAAAAQWGSGRVLHVTAEMDGHVNDRRWMEFVVVPARDPVIGFNPSAERLNASNMGLIFSLAAGDQCTLDVYPGAPADDVAARSSKRLWGAAGQAPISCERLGANDLGYDQRARYDLFLTQSRVALFVDGHLVQQSDVPSGMLPWAYQPVKVYFTHYVYHTDNDISELLARRCTPLNAFWFNDPIRGTRADQNTCKGSYPAGFGFPRSDERHWDNLGFEVLPPTNGGDDFTSLGLLVQPPSIRPPVY